MAPRLGREQEVLAKSTDLSSTGSAAAEVSRLRGTSWPHNSVSDGTPSRDQGSGRGISENHVVPSRRSSGRPHLGASPPPANPSKVSSETAQDSSEVLPTVDFWEEPQSAAFIKSQRKDRNKQAAVPLTAGMVVRLARRNLTRFVSGRFDGGSCGLLDFFEDRTSFDKRGHSH